MRTDLCAKLRRAPLFQQRSAAALAELAERVEVLEVRPGAALMREGDLAAHLHILLDGAVELFCEWRGRRSVLATAAPVAPLALAASLKGAPYLVSAAPVERSRIARLPSRWVRRECETNPRFAQAVALELAESSRREVKHLKDMKLRDAAARLANFLLRQSLGRARGGEYTLTLEKRRIASYLGMTPENLSRRLKLLRAHGVCVQGRRVTISDFSKLKAFAGPTPWIDDPWI